MKDIKNEKLIYNSDVDENRYLIPLGRNITPLDQFAEIAIFIIDIVIKNVIASRRRLKTLS